MELLAFIICFFASVVGAICGIGGGVIIKPLLDAVGIYDVATVSFMSGCTVLAMTTYSVIQSKRSGKSKIECHTGLPLASGAAIGGLAGKWLFAYIKDLSGNLEQVGLIQATCLFVVTIGTLIYTLQKRRIKTLYIRNLCAKVGIGLGLGMLSAFLGIGGGPINLVVMFFFFSMDTKTAAENSLYIIFFSQIMSLMSSVVGGSVPVFEPISLVLMVCGGILGGICGRTINKKLAERHVDNLFVILMIGMLLTNVYNIFKFGRLI